jgi:phage shock protein C
MYCPQCGKEYTQRVNFCCQCGTALFTPVATSPKKLARSRTDRKIAGVCAGFAEYLELDVTLVRILWLMLIFFGGWGLLGYLIAWIVMPLEPAQQRAAAPQASASAQPVATQ